MLICVTFWTRKYYTLHVLYMTLCSLLPTDPPATFIFQYSICNWLTPEKFVTYYNFVPSDFSIISIYFSFPSSRSFLQASLRLMHRIF